MKRFYMALAVITAGGMLVLGSSSLNAQTREAEVTNVENVTAMKTLLKKSFAKPRYTINEDVKKLPGQEWIYEWDITRNEFIEQEHLNFDYFTDGNMKSKESIRPGDVRNFITYDYDSFGNVITETMHDYDRHEGGLDLHSNYIPSLRLVYEYDDVVRNFAISKKQDIYVDGNWNEQDIFKGKRVYTITRDDQQRVVKNVCAGINDMGAGFKTTLDVEYNDDGTVSFKKYENQYDEEVLTGSLDSVLFYKTSNQFLMNDYGIKIDAIFNMNQEYGTMPLKYTAMEGSTKKSYTYTYNDEGVHTGTHVIIVDEKKPFNTGMTLEIFNEDGKRVQLLVSGMDLNKDGLIRVGDDYIAVINRAEYFEDEYGTEYDKKTYNAKITHNGMSATTEDDIEYTFSGESFIDITYEDGVPMEMIYQFRVGENDPFVNQRKFVYKDYVTITPTDISNISENKSGITYAGDKLMLGVFTDYIIYDVEGRIVMNGMAQNVNVGPLARGMYIVKAGGKTMKFVR